MHSHLCHVMWWRCKKKYFLISCASCALYCIVVNAELITCIRSYSVLSLYIIISSGVLVSLNVPNRSSRGAIYFLFAFHCCVSDVVWCTCIMAQLHSDAEAATRKTKIPLLVATGRRSFLCVNLCVLISRGKSVFN